jgi:hypothetical protein
MKNRTHTAFFAMIVLAAASCGGGRPKSTAAQGGAAVRTIALSDSLAAIRNSDTIYMGRMKSGEIVEVQTFLENAGNTPWVVTGVDKSCGCVEIGYPSKPLKPGEKAPMTVTFDSRGLAGFVYKNLLLKTSLSAGPFTLVVTADVEQ